MEQKQTNNISKTTDYDCDAVFAEWNTFTNEVFYDMICVQLSKEVTVAQDWIGRSIPDSSSSPHTKASLDKTLNSKLPPMQPS